MRTSISLGMSVCLLLASPTVLAQGSLAVLPVDYGTGPLEEADRLRVALAARCDETVLSRAATEVAVRERYAEPEGINPERVMADAVRAEDAYYEMRFADAVEITSGSYWLAAEQAVVDMALESNLAASVRRGLMARGRSQFYADRVDEAEETFRANLRAFPTWVATTDWYQPEFVDRYNLVRDAYLSGAGTLEVGTPDEGCIVSVNGEDVGSGTRVSIAAAAGPHAVRVRCDGVSSRVHRLDFSGEAAVFVDPAFDAAFDSAHGQIAVEGREADEVEAMARMARAYGDVVGATRVVVAGVTPDDQLQLLDVRAGSVARGVRAERGEQGRFPLIAAVDTLNDGAPRPGVAVAQEGTWAAMGPAEAPSRLDIASWVAFGVGGAGLILGTAFAIVESNAFDDFEACRDDPICAGGPDLEPHRSDADTAGLVATIGFGIGIAGVVTGAVLLLLDRRAEQDVDAGVMEEETVWLPEFRGAVGPDGGGVFLGWTF